MLKGIDLSQRIEFSCKEDVEPKTVFVFKPLSGLEMMDVSKSMSGDSLVLTPTYVLSVFKKSIIEVKNPELKDSDEIIDFVSGLPTGVLTELLVEINKINNLTGEDEKN